MSKRSLLLLTIASLVLASSLACALTELVARAPAPALTPTRTPKPTFTPTPVETPTPEIFPTATPLPPTPTPEVPPTPTPEPATPTPEPPTPAPQPPTPTPAPVVIVQQDKVNVRQGPGTAYNTVGQVTKGTSLQIVGKNAAGDWWQVCCVSNQQVWITGQLVQVQGDTSTVPVVASVPPPPPAATPRPRPTPTPAAPAPTPRPLYVYNKVLLQRCEHNAGTTAIEGTVYQNHTPFNGARVVFSYAPDGPWVPEEPMISGPHTGYPGWNTGFYSHIVQQGGPREGDWYVWIVDDSGNRISEMSPRVHTDATASEGKCQKAIVDFDTN